MTQLRLFFWIPQLLTGLRLLAGPFVIWTLLNNHNTLSFWLVCAAGLSDWLDGASARYLGIESDFGRLFDPIADKIFVTSVCIGLVLIGLLPLWLVNIIIFRDFLIILGGIIIKYKKIDISLSPIRISKYNTFFQMGLIGWLLMHPLLPAYDFYPLFSNILIYVTLTTTLLSGLLYARIFIKFYRTT